MNPEQQKYKNMRDNGQKVSPQVGYYCYGGYRGLHNLPGSNKYLFLRWAGEEKCEPGHYFDAERDEYHLHVVLKGKGVFRVNGGIFPLGEGDLFVAPKKKPYHYQADMEDPWHYVWVALDGSEAWKLLQTVGFSEETYTRKANAPVEEYASIVYEILNTPNLTHAHMLRRMGSLYSMLSLLANSSTEDLPKTDKLEHVEQAMTYVKENYATATVAGMAEYAGVTRNHLFTLFKRELKISPQQYLSQYRMEEAVRMLEGTEMPISEIATRVGYEDPLSFTKTFRRFYNMSPRDFRKIIVQNE